MREKSRARAEKSLWLVRSVYVCVCVCVGSCSAGRVKDVEADVRPQH